MWQSPDSKYYNTNWDWLPLVQWNADVSNNKTIKRIWTREVTKTANIWDIIMSVRAPVGTIAVADFDCCIWRWVCSIKWNTNQIHSYLKHFLIKNEVKWRKYTQWSTFEAVNSIDIKSFRVILPKSIPEQKAIASILSSCDETIIQTQQLIGKLERRHKALCQQLLTGKKRVAGFSGEWKEEKIGKYITYTPRAVEKPSTNYLALWVRSHAKGMFQKPETNQNENAMDILYEVKKDDLVMSITFAREHAVAIAREIDDWWLVSHRFPTYVFKEGKATPQFFKFFIKESRFKYQLWVISPGGAWRNRVMSKKDFVKLRITIPKLDEQIAISEILEVSEWEIKEFKEKLKKLQELKKWLMQQLLTGKKRVNLSLFE
jgi:type I restriction enzyme, S subunit